MEKISDRIKVYRKKRGFNQTALALKLCVDRSLISKWETGSRQPPEELIPHLAKVLRVDQTQLLYGAAISNSDDWLCISHLAPQDKDRLKDLCHRLAQQ